MKYALHITPSAERDIGDAADYIEYTLMNPQAADELLDAVEEVLSTFRERPQRIRTIPDPVLEAWGIRFVRIKNYLAFFVVDEERHRVNVVRFLYAKRNWMKLLREEKPDME